MSILRPIDHRPLGPLAMRRAEELVSEVDDILERLPGGVPAGEVGVNNAPGTIRLGEDGFGRASTDLSPDVRTPLLMTKNKGEWAKEGGWSMTMDPVLLESACDSSYGLDSHWSDDHQKSSSSDASSPLPICECNPDENGDPTVSQNLSCQGKVSGGKMKMVDYENICKCSRTYIIVDSEEIQRLEKAWKTTDTKGEWVWNEKEQCYTAKFL